MAIRRMVGIVDGKEIIFRKDSGSLWTAAVPLDLDGEYIVEVRAFDEAGNEAYSTNMLFIVDPSTLDVKIIPLDYAYNIQDPDIKQETNISNYVYYAINSDYRFTEITEKYTFRVVT